MAEEKKPGIGRIHGSSKEAKELFRANEARRKTAKNILDDKMLGSGDGLSQELRTVINGEYRPLTHEDLALFRRRADAIREQSTTKQLKGGIRPQQVIAMAKPSPNIHGDYQKAPNTDIGRANSQIHMAVLAGANKGLLRFVTNASGETKGVYRHHVNVRLMSYGEAVAMPKDPKQASKIGKWLSGEPVRFECDCGRHDFWFRYVASIGGWAEGRIETGYPKVRNKNLIGVACKHVLRVMRELNTSHHVHGKIGQMVMSDKRITTTQKEADRRAKSQKKSPKVIDHDSAVKAADRANKKLLAKIKKAADVRAIEEINSKGKSAAKSAAIARAKLLLTNGIISQQDFDVIVRGLG